MIWNTLKFVIHPYIILNKPIINVEKCFKLKSIFIFVLYRVSQKMSSFVHTSEFGKWLNFEQLPDLEMETFLKMGLCHIAVFIINTYNLTESWYIIENLSLVCKKIREMLFFKFVIWRQNWRWDEIRIHVFTRDMTQWTKHDIVPFSITHTMFQN